MQLPLFPAETKHINSTLGVFEKGGDVYYLHNGSPIFCHNKNDLNTYRYIAANLVEMGLCKPSELSQALGVGIRNIQRYTKTLRKKGTDWFFNREDNRGKCYKMVEENIKKAQELLDKRVSVTQTARQTNVTEATIRYHIRTGKLKKT